MAWSPTLIAMVVALAEAAITPSSARPLTSETAKRVSTKDLEQLVVATFGRNARLIDVEHSWFTFRATVRMTARAEGFFCSAPQLKMRFFPDPNRAPRGTIAGAIHVSRLPMTAREVQAVQVYRPFKEQLMQWKRLVEPDPCGKVDLSLPFFAAESSQAAAHALTAVEELVRRAADAARPLALDCSGAAEISCRRMVAALSPDTIEAVSTYCRGPAIALAPRGRCIRVELRTKQTSANSRSYRTLEILLSDGAAEGRTEIERARFSTAHITV